MLWDELPWQRFALSVCSSYTPCLKKVGHFFETRDSVVFINDLTLQLRVDQISPS